jgi:Ca-activated chloride channel family protein
MKFNLIAGCMLALLAASCSDARMKKNATADSTIGFVAPAAACIDLNAPPLMDETYSPIAENNYKSSKSDPLSTFSIDVDGASYSNSRRMLMEGFLPPPDAVRIEEFVNYFTYAYPKPTNGEPFSIYNEYHDCPWAPGHKLLQIGLKGKEVDLGTAPNNNLVFLIDVSGSMDEADKLPLLIRSFKLLVKQLKEDDRISLVVYAGNAGVVLDGAKGSEPERILAALDNLQAGGSTAGGEGIELAYKIAKEHYIKKGNNRVILATDGDFNVGISDQVQLEQFIASKRDDGLYLSVLGFGTGNIKDNNMETLADKGNGNYNYIDNFMEARKVLVSQFGGTLVTIAKDVKIQVEFNPAKVKEYRLIGYENRLLNNEDFNDDKKDAGEIGAGHCVTALYEIIPAGSKEIKTSVDDLKYKSSAVNNFELATLKLRYKNTGKNDTVSRLIAKTLLPSMDDGEPSADFKLAAGVAEFGMLLRDSKHADKSTFEQSIELAGSATKNDPEGYISGLIEMIKISKELKSGLAKK